MFGGGCFANVVVPLLRYYVVQVFRTSCILSALVENPSVGVSVIVTYAASDDSLNYPEA